MRKFLPEPALSYVHFPNDDFPALIKEFIAQNIDHPDIDLFECLELTHELSHGQLGCRINKLCSELYRPPKMIFKFRMGDEYQSRLEN